MARYERTNGKYDIPLIYFDRKTKDAALTEAEFAQAISQTFPQNANLQRALTDYARDEGRFASRITTKDIKRKVEVAPQNKITVTRKVYKVKVAVTRGKHKGKTKPVNLISWLRRPTTQKQVRAGKTPYVTTKGVIKLITPRQSAAYRRASKVKPPLIDWEGTRRQGKVVFNVTE